MKFDIHSYCAEVFSQIEIDQQGNFSICCLSMSSPDKGMAIDQTGNVMNIMTHTIAEAINSETHKQHRLELSQNIRPKRCEACYHAEDAGGGSKRKGVLEETIPLVPEYVKIDDARKYMQIDGSTTSKVVNLDIMFGNKCNQKCIMCGPKVSDQWYDDWKAIASVVSDSDPTGYKASIYKTYSIKEDSRGKLKLDFQPWWETDKWWNEFETVAPNLRYIYFTGGEPLIVSAMEECLNRLIVKNYAKDIILRYDTNLSVINKNIISKWKHFKKIILCVSVDDTENRYNLIRNPGNYNTLIKNIETLMSNNIPIEYLSGCIGIATPYSVLRLYELAEKYKLKLFMRFLGGPEWLNIRYLPPLAKQEIMKKLVNSKYIIETWVKSQILLLYNFMTEYDRNKIVEFVQILDILDKQRNLEWRKILPDVYDLLKRYCPDVIE
jgi:hypothetical protein